MAPVQPASTGQLKGRLQTESLLLAKLLGEVAYDREDGTWFHVPNFILPPGWNKRSVEILIDIPHGVPGYPQVPPQWFWTDLDLKTSDGRPLRHFFRQGHRTEDKKYIDRGWGHYCAHLERGARWQPAAGGAWRRGHNLVTYVNMIRTILQDREEKRFG